MWSVGLPLNQLKIEHSECQVVVSGVLLNSGLLWLHCGLSSVNKEKCPNKIKQ